VRVSTSKRRRLSVRAAAAAAAALAAITLSSDQSWAGGQRHPANHTVIHVARNAQGMMVVIDPDTGLPRDPTPEELLELSGQSTQTAEAPEPIVSVTGFSGLRLGDDQMTFTVATKRADGTIAVEHAIGRHEAEQRVRDGAAGGGLAAGKEQVVER